MASVSANVMFRSVAARSFLVLLTVGLGLACTTTASAAVQYFDVNGTSGSSGVVSGNTYAWNTSSTY